VNAYFHIDAFARHLVDDLSLSELANIHVVFDAHNPWGRGALYTRTGTRHEIRYGDGTDYTDSYPPYCIAENITIHGEYPDAAEDADIVIHEFTHAITFEINEDAFSTTDGDMWGIREGYPDYCAVSYRRACEQSEGLCPLFQRRNIGPWYQRTYDHAGTHTLQDAYHWPENSSPGLESRILWASTLMEIEEAVGHNRGLRIAMSSMGYFVPSQTFSQAANILVQAALDLYGVPEATQVVRVLGRRGFVPLRRGEVDASQTWSQHGLLTGDVRVGSGVTLTIAPFTQTVAPGKTIGSVVIASAAEYDSANVGGDASRVELIVEGNLAVNGTSTRRVRFGSAGKPPTEPGSTECTFGLQPPEEGDWWGISVADGGDLNLTGATVEYADCGAYVATDEETYIGDCVFSHNTNYDIWVQGGGEHRNGSTITENSITVDGGTGIYVTDGISATVVTDNTITGSSSTSHGIDVASSSSPTISRNSVTGVSAGNATRISSGSPTLTENHLQSSKYGLWIGAGSAAVGDPNDSGSDNIISGNTTTGLYTEGSSTTPVVRNNQITSNYNGVVTKTCSNPDLGQSVNNPGDNSITSNTSYCLWNRSTGSSPSNTIKAQANWWGSNPPPNCFSGSIDATNYLTSAPATLAWGIELVGAKPTLLVVHGGWPNPFSSTSAIRFEIDHGPAPVRAEVFRVDGARVRDLGERNYEKGAQEVFWDGRNDEGSPVPAGVYFVRVAANGKLHGTAKVLVVR
jgi:hypothetical protein